MSAAIPNRIHGTPQQLNSGETALIPDFPYDYGRWLNKSKQSKTTLVSIPLNTNIAIVGAGAAGLVSAYELMRAGLNPIIFEASGRIGGRMKSVPRQPGGFAEMGCMRFPPTCTAVFHYFDKVGASYGPFPNPGTAAAPGNVVDYKGVQQYYDVNNPSYPIPPEYQALESKWNQLLEGKPFRFNEMRSLLSQVASASDAELSTLQQKIKSIWNPLVGDNSVSEAASYDNKTFHRALIEAGWNFNDVELFGQVGFGSGGWNTDFVNCFLEVIRVEYTLMDSDHQLIYNGSVFLPDSLWNKSANELGDVVASGVDPNRTLKQINDAFWQSDNYLYNEVRAITPTTAGSTGTGYEIYVHNSVTDESFSHKMDAVIYTPHVRSLQMMRAKADKTEYQAMNSLFSQDLWEAIEYTHYMQSSKTFIQVKEPFWNNTDAAGKHDFSVTLSDRLTRGTYVFAYDSSVNNPKGYGICTSYTWNDDSLKFSPFTVEERVTQTLNVLQDIYPNIDFASQIVETNPYSDISWESETYYMGAFKNNLPGQYRYQRALYTQFMQEKSGFILAGDDISWTAGWLDGAITTALNAVNKVADHFGGGPNSYPGPIDLFESLKPIER